MKTLLYEDINVRFPWEPIQLTDDFYFTDDYSNDLAIIE
jgi:hypothetical protein